MSEKTDKHNKLAPEIFKRIIRETSSQSEAMVLLESIVLGVMMYHHPDPRHADEMLNNLSVAVLTRMTEPKEKVGA